MECRDERERYESGNVPHDTPHITPEQIALEALIDQLLATKEQPNERA